MNKIKKQLLLHLEYINEEDIKRKTEKQISELTEKQKTDFVFNDEPLYFLGNGHNFIYGFFQVYITKTGIKILNYAHSNRWEIGCDFYEYKNNEFIKLPEATLSVKPITFNETTFPVIKNVSAKSIADDIIPVKPK